MPPAPDHEKIREEISRLELSLQSLTINVKTLTQDVEKLVAAQVETASLMRELAVAHNEQQHIRETVSKLFIRMDKLSDECDKISKDFLMYKVAAESKGNVIKVLFSNWQLIAFVGVLAMMVYSYFKSLSGGG